MSAWRHPLLPVGLILMLFGVGNWYTGVDKGAEYEQLLATGKLTSSVADYDDFPELDASTTGMLLGTLRDGSDESTLLTAKLDFYRVLQSGGRLFVLVGLFCVAAGLTRFWYRRHVAERGALPARRG